MTLVAASILFSGCTTLGPDFKTPEVAQPKEWLETDVEQVKPEASDYSDWWRAFDDPVLNELIDLAYQQNLSLRIAGIRILEARAILGVAVGSQYPQVQQLRGSYSRIENSENTFPKSSGDLTTGFNQWDLGFDATWELDFWGRFRRNLESADANLLTTIADYDAALVSITAEVANTYSLIRTFEERLALARNNVKIQERSLRITDVRFQNGATTELDVRQAETLLHTTQALIPQLETGLRQSKNGLSVLLGLPPSDLQEILGGDVGVIPAPPVEVAVGVPSELLRRRPDVRSAELAAATQSALIGVAQADLYPSIGIAGSVGLRSEDLGDLFKGGSLTGLIQPGFTWNIFNYGRLKNNVRVQDARLQQLLVSYQNTVLNAYREVEDALSGFLRGKERTAYLSQAVDAAQRSVDLALIQYRDGTTDYTRVLNTQDALVGQQDQLTATRGEVVRSLIAMYKALGGGWQLREGKPFVSEATLEQMRARTDWGRVLPPKALPASLETPPPARQQPFFQSPDW
jgi:NodT family efflux transporter outer membrane factor (OMF) lipoprotein